jgi:bifunctional DNA-binding transcriptional regulator/antitoxin component of YhaV-PrlF toxin-antitoxin module
VRRRIELRRMENENTRALYRVLGVVGNHRQAAFPMVTTVTRNYMVDIPADIVRKLGIKAGYRFDWQVVEGSAEILVRVMPDRAAMAERLLGEGRRFSPDRDAVAEFVAERE